MPVAVVAGASYSRIRVCNGLDPQKLIAFLAAFTCPRAACGLLVKDSAMSASVRIGVAARGCDPRIDRWPCAAVDFALCCRRQHAWQHRGSSRCTALPR